MNGEGNPVDVAVIPAAGMGTRMRPATRVVPKPLLPVVDRPAVQYVVEEAARAGATTVYLIVDPGSMVGDHFTEGDPLEGLENVEVHCVVQPTPSGLGAAVATARDVVGDRRFFCLLADNIEPPGFSILTDLLAAAGDQSAVAVRELTPEWLTRYGVIVPGSWRSDSVVEVEGAVEKPGVDNAPSNLGLIGRYLFTPEIFRHLGEVDPGHGGEIQLTDAIDRLAGRCRAAVIAGELLDMGTPAGFLESTATMGLHHPDLGDDFRVFLKGLVE